MRERRKIKVDGKMLPVMTLDIKPTYHPPAARTVNFPDHPKGLSKAALEKWMGETSGKVDAAIAAENERWQRERVPDTQIRIEFMAWAWEGREIGGQHVKSIDGAWLDVHGLHLPDGRVVEHFRAVDLPNDRICSNAAILREERESGVSYVRLEPEEAAKLEATHKRVEALAEVVPEMHNYFLAAVDDALSFKIEMGKQFPLSDKERIVLEAVQAVGGDTMKASRALITRYGKGKGYSQGNVWKIVEAVNTRIKAKRGQGAFDSHEPTRYAHAPEGTNRK